MYAEEFIKYDIASEVKDTFLSERKYEKGLFESIGLVAANPAPIIPWNTAYCIYDKFDISDKYDENYECAVEIRDFYFINFPELAPRADAIFNEYCRKRSVFEPIYRRLPKAVFQGDLNDSNILVDKDGEFKGLIDFNLSGTETIMNYAFCESFCPLHDDSEIDRLLDTEALKMRDEYTRERLALIGKHYKFTDAERQAFNMYYNIVAPFRWTYHSFFMRLLGNREKYPDGRKYAKDILDWVEYQMTRKDTGKLLP